MPKATFAAPPAPPRTCSLCGGAGPFECVAVVPYDAIWAGLGRNLGIDLPDSLVARHTPGPSTALWQCEACGFQAFEPRTGGDGEFYAQLNSSHRYYEFWKWDFDWVLSRLRPSDRVLDVGCGNGAFLMKAKEKTQLAVGIELNATAVQAARERSLDVRDETIEAFSETHAGAFDVACSFHVLEHVENPVAYARAVARCVKPGGRMYLTVPNRHRLHREAVEPLDCPPHHITRWSPENLAELGKQIGCPRATWAFEPIRSNAVRHFIEKKIHHTFRDAHPAGHWPGAIAGWLTSRLLFLPGLPSLYESIGLYAKLGANALALAGEFSVPEPGNAKKSTDIHSIRFMRTRVSCFRRTNRSTRNSGRKTSF